MAGHIYKNFKKDAEEIYDLAYNIELTSNEIRDLIKNALIRAYRIGVDKGRKEYEESQKNKSHHPQA